MLLESLNIPLSSVLTNNNSLTHRGPVKCAYFKSIGNNLFGKKGLEKVCGKSNRNWIVIDSTAGILCIFSIFSSCTVYQSKPNDHTSISTHLGMDALCVSLNIYWGPVRISYQIYKSD